MAETLGVNEETERRIEAAQQEAERQRQTQEFLQSLTANDELLKPVYHPEAYVMREKARGAANRGEIQKTDCTHPFHALDQYVDDVSERGGRPDISGRPVNLFVCRICTMPLWLVDPWGTPVTDD